MPATMLHVNNVCWNGGTMHNTLSWIRAYPEFNHVVRYVHGQEHPEMVKLLQEAQVDFARMGRLTRAAVEKIDPAIIILKNTSGKFVEGSYPCQWLREWPTIYSHHSLVKDFIPCDLHIFNSHHMHEKFGALVKGIAAKRFIGSLIDTDLFVQAKRTPENRSVIIGKLASDQAVKFPKSLISILNEVHESEFCHHVRSCIVGGAKHYGPVAPPRGAPPIEFPDFGSKPAPEFYAGWDILVYKTTDKYTETWCRVITEAMASGLAIVAENKGAIPEQIDHGENGFLASTDEEFVRYLVRFANDPELRFEFGRRARCKAIKNFGLDALRRHTEDDLIQLLVGYTKGDAEVRWGNREEVLSILPKGGIGIELGVWIGEYSELLLEITKPKKLYLVDLWGAKASQHYPSMGRLGDPAHEERYQNVLKRFEEQIASGIVEVRRSLTSNALNSLQDNELDWAYVDADHGFTGCYTDLSLCYRKVKPGGYILGHDFVPAPDKVMDAVTRFLGEHPDVELLGRTAERHATVVLRKGER